MAPMSVGALFLRITLMLSLLLNGLNVAMAAPMALALVPAPEAEAAQPPCHATAAPDAHAAHTGHSGGGAADDAAAPHDGDHCKLKDCLRSCAQQPSLTAQLLWIPTPPPLARAPQPLAHALQPAPPLDRITRPPIV